MTNITFVDENDDVIGSGSKDEAWQKGIRQRIVRVFVLNSSGELLMQKRSYNRASLPGRWDQSAAGHVDEGETYLEAAQREMAEEVGIVGVSLVEVGTIKTDETDEADKIKRRFSKLFVAKYDGSIRHSVDEVSETRWINTEKLKAWMKSNPDEFTEGFMLSFRKFLETRGDSLGNSM